MNDIIGKVAYITGGTKGIGYGIAEAMLAQGMKVAITGRNLVSAQAAAAKLHPQNCIGIASDVTKMQDEKKAIKATLDHFGKIDVVIANAGLGHFASILDLTEEQWHQTIDTNLTGVFHTVKASLDALIASKGYFISIASLAGTNFFAKGSAYNASKFGLVGFTQAVMLDLRQHEIKTSVVMPGSVSTYFNNRTPSEDEYWKIQPEDLGQLVTDLLKMDERSLPSKVEIRPSFPHKKPK